MQSRSMQSSRGPTRARPRTFRSSSMRGSSRGIARRARMMCSFFRRVMSRSTRFSTTPTSSASCSVQSAATIYQPSSIAWQTTASRNKHTMCRRRPSRCARPCPRSPRRLGSRTSALLWRLSRTLFVKRLLLGSLKESFTEAPPAPFSEEEAADDEPEPELGNGANSEGDVGISLARPAVARTRKLARAVCGDFCATCLTTPARSQLSLLCTWTRA